VQIKAIGFDIGQTLVNYNAPLNWNALFPDALRKVMRDCSIDRYDKLDLAAAILSKYNTRENYREYEVSSDIIFKEIFDVWELDYNKITSAKEAFYGFFQADAALFGDVLETLDALMARSVRLGFLTDVAYGMDNIYALRDITEIRHYFDAGFTSVDIGYRKPDARGFLCLAGALGVVPHEMMYVGDEEKDIIGANRAGMVSVLVRRDVKERCWDWGQDYTVGSLSEALYIIT